tara:strand:+ start:281 stop:568 length:288 start_codon:yes stop_codon:yes gene_type:complete
MAAKARIYRPARTAMQQGRAKTKLWVLDFEPSEQRRADPLMGWISSGDTRRQLSLRFDTKEAAIAYADDKGHTYTVQEPRERTAKTKSYSDNFRW